MILEDGEPDEECDDSADGGEEDGARGDARAFLVVFGEHEGACSGGHGREDDGGFGPDGGHGDEVIDENPGDERLDDEFEQDEFDGGVGAGEGLFLGEE